MDALLIVGWFYLTTPDFRTVHMRGPFLSRERCMQHEERYVPRTWESTGCSLKAINLGESKDVSPIINPDKET